MPDVLFATFLRLMKEIFRPALTRPGFANLLVVLVGWVLCNEPVHTVTAALVASSVADRAHYEAFHRFFSRGGWSPDLVGYGLLRWVLDRSGQEPLRVVVDDTLAIKKGPHVFGLGTHLDAVRSTKRWRILAFGHCWVVLALLVRVPFSSRPWALPILFRLYRNAQECKTSNDSYNKKTELAREMIDLVCLWTGDRALELALDLGYCNRTVLRGLPPRVTVFGTMRADAALTELPAPAPGARRRGGRPAKQGARLPNPSEVANDEQTPWRQCQAFLYGRVQTIFYKTFWAQWYRVWGEPLLRVVVVQTSEGKLPCRVFFCTDPKVPIPTVLEGYAGRWNVEVFFRDAKQWLGFADSPARTEAAVRRMAPFVGLLYSLLVLWFAEGAFQSPLAAPPVRPWYRHKKGLSFADILRTARRVLGPIDVWALACEYGKIDKPKAGQETPEQRCIQLAA